MTLTLINTSNVFDDATMKMSGSVVAKTVTVNGTTYLFVAGATDDGVSVFSVSPDGTLTNVSNVADNATLYLEHVSGIATAQVGATTYLFTAGTYDFGISTFSVGSGGALTNVSNKAGTDGDSPFALTTAVVGTTTYLFAAYDTTSASDGALAVFSVGTDGALTEVARANDDATLNLTYAVSVATATVGTTTFAFVAGQLDNGVSVFSVANNGALTNVFNVADNATLNLAHANSVATANVGGTTYLFVAGNDDDGVSVFSVASNGALTNVFNVSDNASLALDGAAELTTAVIGGTTYLFVTGQYDSGFSAFSVGSNGALTSVANIANAGDSPPLSTAYGITTGAAGGQQFLFVSTTSGNVAAFSTSNTAPVVNANTGLTLAEGATATVTTAKLDFNDAEQADTAITYTITTAVTNGTLYKSGVALALNGTFTQDDINNSRITYTHNGSETTSASFGFSVSDGAGATVTGQSFAFAVTPVNDPPVVNANTGITVAEGATVTITTARLDFNDAEQADTAITYKITTVATNGTLYKSGVALALNGTFTQDDINNSRITYTHNGSETTSASFGFSVSDGAGGTVTGQSFAFTVTPVNDAPTQAANAGLTLDEGATATVTTAKLDFNDAEQADTAITYTITTAATNGTLYKSGVALALNGTFTQDDINNNRITYTHNGSETTSASFGFSVSDGAGGTVTGQSFAFTVTPVADVAPTFLTGGEVSTSLSTAGDNPLSLTILADGKYLLAGSASAPFDTYTFALARYNSDGTLDTSFSGDGKLTTSISVVSRIYDAVQQSDGKIVVAGSVGNFTGYDAFGLARYNADGTLDTTFGTNGIVQSDLGWADSASGIALQSDGKFVVVGSSSSQEGTFRLAVARYNTNGTLDTSFSGDGVANPTVGTQDIPYDVLVQPDGKIVVTGYTYLQVDANADVFVLRLNSNGSLDTTFSSDGIVTTAIGSSIDIAQTVALSSGKILVAGYATINGHNQMALVRYNTNGSLDTSFGGGDGIVTMDIGGAATSAQSVVVQSDGKILVAGSTGASNASQIALVRFNTDGTLDTSFGGGDGIVTTSFAPGVGYGYDVDVQSNGKILVSGSTGPSDNVDFTLLRYNSDGSLDATFNGTNTVNPTAAYAEGVAPTVLSPNIAITDDGTTLARATVHIANGFAGSGDVLAANVSGTSITASYNAATGTLTLTGTDTIAHYEQVLRTVTYQSTSSEPTDHGAYPTRSIEWQVFDSNTPNATPFGTAASLTTATTAYDGKLADLNGDGKLDLIYTQSDQTQVFVAFGDGTGSFGAQTAYTAGSGTRGLAIGDFDGDGDNDIVVALTATNKVALLTNNGSGSFAAAQVAGSDDLGTPGRLAIGDFNRDGVLDLIVSGGVLLGNGDGTFRALSPISGLPAISGIVSGDFNNDGKLDFATVNNSAALVTFFAGNGDGTFATGVAYSVGAGSQRMAVGDIDNDGDLDLVTTSVNSASVAILLNSGSGTFTVSTMTGFPVVDRVELADVDGDGKLDMAVASAGSLRLLHGNGDGTFTAIQTVANVKGIILPGDLNGDGALDIATIDVSGTASTILLNTSGNQSEIETTQVTITEPGPPSLSAAASATFTENGAAVVLSPSLTLSDDGTTLAYATVHIAGGYFPGSGDVLAVDPAILSGTSITASYDAATETLTLSGTDTLAHYQQVLRTVTYASTSDNPTDIGAYPTRTIEWQVSDGTAAPTTVFQAATTVSVTVGNHLADVLADINGDGIPDLIYDGIGGSSVYVAFGNGAGSFGVSTVYSGLNGSTTGITVADLDGDGDRDIVVAATAGTYTVLRNDGTGHFTALPAVSVGADKFAAGDFNRDGKIDLVAARGFNGNAQIVLGKGDGTFGDPSSVGAGNGTLNVVAADFNNDGKLDLAFGDTNKVDLVLGDGNGGFGAATTTSINGGGGVRGLAVADFNNDGRLDIAAVEPTGFSVLIQNANGSFTTADISTDSMFGIAIGDFNGDGNIDVVGSSSNGIRLLLGNGDGTFQPVQTYAAGSSPSAIAAADINHDGVTDLVGSQPSSTNELILLGAATNLSATQTTVVSVTAVNDPPVAVADTYAATEDTALTVTAANGVLKNDTDAENGTLTAIKVSDPAHGTLTLNSDGSFTYTPAANFNGTDSFTYKANDGTADSSAATVTLNVAGVNDAPTIANLNGDSVTFVRGGAPVILDLNDNSTVTDVDSDFDGGTITLAFTANGTAEDRFDFGGLGAFAVNQKIFLGTSFSYAQVDQDGTGGNALVMSIHGAAAGSDIASLLRGIEYVDTNTSNPSLLPRTVQFTLTDGDGGSANASVTVNMDVGNTPPTQHFNTGLTLDEGATATLTATQLDFDDAQQADTAITYTITTAATNGTLFKNGTTALGLNGTFTQDDIDNGRITYTHDGSETTSASFGFSVSDGAGGTVTGQSFAFTVTPVDDAPTVGVNAGKTLNEGATVLITAAQLDVNDADNTDTQLTYTITSAATHGLLRKSGVVLGLNDTFTQQDINLNRITYTHDGSETTSDGITFNVTDGAGGALNNQTFNFAVTPQADAPAIAGVSASSAFTEGSSAVVLSPSLTLSADGTTLGHATVHIADFFPGSGDVLAANTNGTSITASYNAATGTLTLSGTDTVAHYQQVLRTVTYQSSSTEPTDHGLHPTRTVEWQVGDGTAAPSTVFSDGIITDISSTPRVLKIADVNGDGKADLIYTDATPSLKVAFGDGTGSFGTPTSYALNNSNAKFVVVDADGDGDRDIVVGDSNALRILRNDGHGSFTPLASTSFTGGAPFGLTVGDFNHDGALDAIVATSSSSAPFLFLGNGAGTFGAGTAIDPDGQTRGLNVVSGDFNNDGNLDFATIMNQSSATLRIMLGHGDGTFSVGNTYTVGTTPISILAADLDNDGDIDLVTGNNSSTTVLLNDGNGAFTIGTASLGSTIDVADVNGDGKLDLVSTTRFQVGNGDGTFQAPTTFTQFSLSGAVTTGDLDGNGTPDVVATTTVNGIVVLLNASHNQSAVATTTVTVTDVNAAPTAVADTYAATEDTPLTITAANGVLKNDTDAESDPLTAIKVTNPAHGAVTLNSNGSFTYTPNANFNGTDSFTYKANDGTSDSNTVTVTLNVGAVNDAPTAAANTGLTLNEGATATLTTAQLDVTDVDNTAAQLTYTITSAATHGTLFKSGVALALNGTFTQDDIDNGRITYTHDGGETTSAAFGFSVSDGTNAVSGQSFAFTVTPVNDKPTVGGLPASLNFTEDTAGNIDLSAATFADPDTATITVTLSASSGTITLNGADFGPSVNLVGAPATLNSLLDNASYVGYKPAADFNGPATLTVSADDGSGSVQLGTVTLNVAAVNDAPVATSDTYAATEDTPLVVNAANGVLKNDTDAESDPLTAIKVTGPAHGAVTLNANGSFTYTPTANYNGTDSFSYKANDGAADSAPVTVTINVGAVNNAPTVATPIADQSSAEDTAWTFQVAANTFTDVDGDTLAYTATLGDGTALPSWLTFNTTTRTFTGTPPQDFNGTIDLIVTASDGALSVSDTFGLNVTPVNDPPTITATPRNGTYVEDDVGVPTMFYSPTVDISTVESGQNIDRITLTIIGIVDGASERFVVDGSNIPLGSSTSLTTPNSGIGVSIVKSGTTANITLTKTGGLSVTDAETLLGLIGLYDSSENPTAGDRVMTLTSIRDTGGTANGGHDTTTLSLFSTFTIVPVNDPPTLGVNGGTNLNEGAVRTILAADLTFNDVDNTAAQISYTLTTAPAHGTLWFDVNGNNTLDAGEELAVGETFTQANINTPSRLKYTHDGSETTADSFGFNVSDGAGGLVTGQTFAITVNPINDKPVVANAITDQTVNEDTAWSFQFAANSFYDPDSSLTYTATLSNGAALPSWLTFTGSTRTFSGTPPANFNGQIDLKVTASDGTWTVSDTFSLTVAAVNDAPVVANTIPDQNVNEDTAWNFQFASNAFTDVDNASLTYMATLDSGAALPAWLTFTAATRTFSGTPPQDFNGALDIKVTASDGSLDVSDTFRLTVVAVNDAPVAQDDRYTTSEDTPLVVAATGVLGNDTDVDGDALHVSSVVTGPAHGSLTLNADGSFTYTPDALYHGSDSFTYKANDGTADSNVATVTLNITGVNHAPTAQDDHYTTSEDTPLVIAAAGVRGNDTDVDGDALHVSSVVTGPAHGSLTLNADGSFSYTPDANYNGADSFTYKANDGTADSNTATVSLTISAVNDAPVAQDDHYTTSEDTPLVIAATGVLGNDTDIDSDPLHVSVVNGPAHGSLVLNADGSFSYTPDANYNGADSFTYKANDSTADSNTAAVSLTISAVNDAPVGHDDTYAASAHTTLIVDAAHGVLANDTDVDTPAGSLSALLVATAGHGALGLAADGSFTYTPDTGFSGIDSFTYKVNDGSADSSTVTITLNVAAASNIAPVAVPDTYAGTEDTHLAVDAAHGVLANDTDIDTPAGSLSALLVSTTGHGALDLAADGSFTYAPDANFDGTDSFTYKVNDGTGDSGIVTVTLNIGAVNDAPTDIGLSHASIAEVSPDGTVVGTLSAVDPDAGDAHTYALLDDAGGRFAIDGDSLVVNNYILLDYEQNASHSVTVQVTDSGGLTFDKDFTIAVTDVDSETVGGTAAANHIDGGIGADVINGGGGNDVIDGGIDNDLLGGGTGGDSIVGGDGNDTIWGEDGNDSLGGNAGNDVIIGGTGDDTIGGDDGNDVLNGGDGNDTIWGGAGDDQIGAGAGNDTVIGDDGNDTIWGEDGNDVINAGSGDDLVLAGNGDDQVGGGLGNDDLRGEAGNDILWAEAGNDTLTGGPGDDIMIGGAGSDTFVLGPGDGHDVITDFTPTGPATDHIWLAGTDLHSFADVVSHANFNAATGATTITHNGSDTIVLNGVALANLTAADFLFS